jgi:CRP-like cAMP-binding protein
VGRDIVQLHVDRPGDYDLSQNLYQAGEAIAVEGVQSRYVHVIVEGEVELIEVKGDGATRVLKTLGPGDHFGIRWIESFEREIARAKTQVRTIAVRRDQAPELQEVLDSAGRLVAESGHFPAITRDMGPIPTPTDGE